MNNENRTYKIGDRAYLLENNRTVKEVVVLNCFGGIYTVMFKQGGATKVKGHRLFESPEAAERSNQEKKRPIRSPHTAYT